MAKPIFIVKFGRNFTAEMRDAAARGLRNSNVWDEYHVLFCPSSAHDGIYFQIFSDKEIEPIELEKLREEIGLANKTEPVSYHHGSHDALKKLREDGGN